MGNDRGFREHKIAIRMVAVVMSVDQCPDRQWGQGSHAFGQAPGPGGGESRIDHRHPAASEQHTGIVQAPAAIKLNEREDVIADLRHGRGCGVGMKMDLAHAVSSLITRRRARIRA